MIQEVKGDFKEELYLIFSLEREEEVSFTNWIKESGQG